MELLVQSVLRIRDDGQDHAERCAATKAVLVMLQEELGRTLGDHGFALDADVDNRVYALIMHPSEVLVP